MKTISPLFLFWIVYVLVILLGWRIDLMDVDAAQYASISKEMLDKKSFLQIYDLHRDYLDKPPLLFWLASMSMSIFGSTDWAFRLPSLLGIGLAIYATYRLALLHYTSSIAIKSAIIVATSQALFLVTHDCRTDSLLMCFVTVALWQLAEAFNQPNFKNWLGAFTAIAAALLTKGPIGLIVPVFAFIGHIIYTKTYRDFFRKEYIWGLIWIGILLIPMCIGLYQQFDLHPEKVLYGRKNTSGLRFFFWTQSFGRITGESTWKENGEFFFLLQNMLWSFAPWILFALGAIIYQTRQVVKHQAKEALHLSAFVLTYCALAQSNYQLPHYIFVVFPSLAILTAFFLEKVESQYQKNFLGIAGFIAASISFVCIWLHIYAFPMNTLMMLALVGCGGIIVWIITQQDWRLYFKILVGLALIVNVFLSGWVYPNLLNYQEGSQIGKFVRQAEKSKNDFYLFDKQVSHSLAFYAGFIPEQITDLNTINAGNWILTTNKGIEDIKQAGFNYKILFNGCGTSVTNLNVEFLNKNTRNSKCETYWLIAIEGKETKS